MKNLNLLASCAIAAFGAGPALAQAVCSAPVTVDGAPSIVCDQPLSVPLSSALDGLTVRIDADAGILSDDRDAPPLDIAGDDVTVLNDGALRNTDARNNADAIAVTGTRLSIQNSGVIESGDRAIQVFGGAGGLSVYNGASGEILARRQAIRSLEGFENARIENYGLISSTDGRALQLRGNGAQVFNFGTLSGGEEVVEARGDFYMENRGDVILKDGVADEDGVQFASGELQNFGLIRGSDDAVDLDEGLIHNHAGARLISTGDDSIRNAGGIDVDAEFDNGVDPERPAGDLTIINEGYIEGPRAIVTDITSMSRLDIFNSGTLYGRSGIAVDLSPDQGDSRLTLAGKGKILGDVTFGGGDDNVIFTGLQDGAAITGIVDGGMGDNIVSFADYLLSDVLSFTVGADLVELSLGLDGGLFQSAFRNFDGWSFADGSRYSTSDLDAAINPAPVPLPAGLPLLTGALGGIWLIRRRRAA